MTIKGNWKCFPCYLRLWKKYTAIANYDYKGLNCIEFSINQCPVHHSSVNNNFFIQKRIYFTNDRFFPPKYSLFCILLHLIMLSQMYLHFISEVSFINTFATHQFTIVVLIEIYNAYCSDVYWFFSSYSRNYVVYFNDW